MLIDSHCHLHFPGLVEDVKRVIDTAKEASVKYLITISTQLPQVSDIQNLIETYPAVFGTTGVHPCDAYQDAELYDVLLEQAKHPKIVGFGETGLDYFHKTVSESVQQECFEVHIEAANKAGLPLVIHTRDAEADTLGLLKKSRSFGVLHCFTGSYDMAKQALDLGFYISFSGILTYTSAENLREVARKIPKDRVLLETDAPYLVPKGHRSNGYKTNQPAFIRETCEVLANVWQWSVLETAHQTTQNCLRLFQRLPQEIA